MANDTDLWNDVEQAELKEPNSQHTKDLQDLYLLRYVEYDEKKLEEFKEVFFERHNYLPNI